MSSKPTIPEVVDRFAAYYARNPTWGSLHVVLDDGNFGDAAVKHCLLWAQMDRDKEGYELASIMLRMSKTQRSKAGRAVKASHGGKPFIMFTRSSPWLHRSS